ncbi:uncharacterized protein EI90DRAFT_3049990 [Cantharellus anzutake]|uniref:uncharacterized protein n=1 Tax=Cantharellus anzutake TaxID=1750568 RepID=UPI001908FCF5|nr:uncharacterized protein EI90DRAFT_3049990 [Cantharellus anzutake]KAF8334727.1 hypothetical protein EI90DRAFT_3049990 [Cantharellus anzutake]
MPKRLSNTMRFWNLFGPIALLPIAAADFLVGTVDIFPPETSSYFQGGAVNVSDNNCKAAATTYVGAFVYGADIMQFKLCESTVKIFNSSLWVLVLDETELIINGTCTQIQKPIDDGPCFTDKWSQVSATWTAELLCSSVVCLTGELD